MAGRGRNRPHRRKKETPEEAIERDPGCQVDASEADGTAAGPSAEDASKAISGPVPRVSMDFFYVSSRQGETRKGVQGMSTKELKKRLKEMGKSAEGARNELIKRYERCEVEEDHERPQEDI